MQQGIDDFINLPDKLLSAKRWLLWKEIPASDPSKKPRKIPFYTNGTPRNGALESQDDINQLSSFEDAVKLLKNGSYTGLGFAFGQDGETDYYFQGIDIDKINDHPELMPIVESLPGYIEKSPSHNGFHCLGYGIKFDALGSNNSGIEAYSSGRYFTVTGETVSGFELHDLSDIVVKKLKPIHDINNKYHDDFGGYDEISVEDIRLVRSALNCFTADDRDRWVRYGHALCRLGNVGRSIWMDWSRQSDKYDPLRDSKTWDSFKGDNTGYPAILKDAYAFGWDGNKKVATIEESLNLEWLDGDSMSDSLKPTNYLIADILESDSHGMFAGDSMSFKTFIALRLAWSICTGSPFFDHQSYNTGKVLYVCGEGKNAFAKRIKAISIVDGGFNNNLLVLNDFFTMDDEESMTRLRVSITKHNPLLVIFDTFGSLVSNTDENSATDVGKVLKIRRETCSNGKTSSIIVHHYGKDSSRGMRGSIAFKANCDFEYSSARVKDSMTTVFSCEKMKDGEMFSPISMEARKVDLGIIGQDGNSETSLVLKQYEGTPLTSKQTLAYDAIRELVSLSGFEFEKKLCVSEEMIKSCLNDIFKSEANRWSTSKKIIDALLKHGYLKNSGDNFHLC